MRSPAGKALAWPLLSRVGMYGDHKDLRGSGHALGSVGILRDDLEVYNSV